MNYYKYIVLQIQDLATTEPVKTLTGFDAYSDSFEVSDKPLEYTVKSDNLEDLLKAKEVMEAALNSMYEVMALTEDVDANDEYIAAPIAVYLDNFIYYNTMIGPGLTNPENIPKLHFKKLNKNRFQIIQKFSNIAPIPIYTFEGDIII